MIIMDSIKDGYSIGTSHHSHYDIDSFTGGLEVFSRLNGVNFEFSKLNHHVFFEEFDDCETHQLGVPFNFSLVYQEGLDFVEGRDCIKIDVSEKEA